MLAVLAVLFILSGAAGLFYESVWSRYLSLFVGHDAYAQILTLVIFLGGMGLGALIVSRRSARIRDPLLVYAVVEGLIGIFGLAFHDYLYLPVTGWAYDHLFPGLGGGMAVVLSKWLLAGLLILPQSMLLGATFPLMTAGALRRIRGDAGRVLSILYFTNSLGAAVGVLVAGFVLFDMAGLPGTLAFAAVLNLVVALGTILVVRADRGREDGKSAGRQVGIESEPLPGESLPSLRPSVLPSGLASLLLILAAGTAIASFVYEVSWIRMLSLVLGSSTHSFELMLSAFILGLAFGALWIRKRADRFTEPLGALAMIQLVMGALALASLPLYLETFQWTASLLQSVSRTDQGYALFTFGRYLLCLAVMLPATFCAGMTLPLMTRILMQGSGESAIGAVYGANTLGSIVGAAVTGLILLPAVGLKGTLILGGMVDIGLGFLVLYVMARQGAAVRPLALGSGAIVAVLLLLALFGVKFDQDLLSSGVFRIARLPQKGVREILYHADGRTASVHASRILVGGTKILATNGKPDGSLNVTWFERCDTAAPQQPFSGDDGTQAMLALLLLAHAPAGKQGAVIGFGTGMSSHFLLSSPAVEQLTTVEIEPAMLQGARVFYPVNKRAYDDPRSHIVVDDAKSYFAAANRRFDFIMSEPSNPWVSGVSGLFTTEFYSRVRHFLAPGGVFGQWLHTYELTDGLVLSVLLAIHENFPDYRIYLINGGDLLVVASGDGPLHPPDWSVTRSAMVRQDLCRFLPMTDPALQRMVVIDKGGLEPLFRVNGRANSDFYPVLDLGAERARFLQESAVGLANLAGGVLDYLADGALRPTLFDTATTSVLTPSPGVKGMLLAAQVRKAGRDPSWADGPGAPERYLYTTWDRTMSGGVPPANWRNWTADFWTIRRALQGANAPPDSAFFARARSYAAQLGAPTPVLSAVDLGEALARRRLADGRAAVQVLLTEARAGRLWIAADDLLDASVRILVAMGRGEDARAAYGMVRPYSTRGPGDLRLALLNAYIEAARNPRP